MEGVMSHLVPPDVARCREILRRWLQNMGGSTASGVVAGTVVVLSLVYPLRVLPTLILLPAALLFFPTTTASDKDDKVKKNTAGKPSSRGWLWEETSEGWNDASRACSAGETVGSREGASSAMAGAAIAEELKALMDLVMRDIIRVWYQTMIAEDDRQFSSNLDEVLDFIIASLSQRLTDVPMSRLASSVEEVLTLLAEHSRCHSVGLAKREAPRASSSPEEAAQFESLLVEEYKKSVRFPSEGCLHPGSKDQASEVRFWRGVFRQIIPLLLPKASGAVRESVVKHLLNMEWATVGIGSDLLASRCLVPLTDLLSDPDFINGLVINIAANHAAQSTGARGVAGKLVGKGKHRRSKSESWMSYMRKGGTGEREDEGEGGMEMGGDCEMRMMTSNGNDADQSNGNDADQGTEEEEVVEKADDDDDDDDDGDHDVDDDYSRSDAVSSDAVSSDAERCEGSCGVAATQEFSARGKGQGGGCGVQCASHLSSAHSIDPAPAPGPVVPNVDSLAPGSCCIDDCTHAGHVAGAGIETRHRSDGGQALQALSHSQEGTGAGMAEEEGADASHQDNSHDGDEEMPYVQSCPVPKKVVIVSASVVGPGDGSSDSSFSVPPGETPPQGGSGSPSATSSAGVGSWVKNAKYAVYVMEVARSDGKGNVVARRYMDFFRLHTILSNGASREQMQQLKLPSRRIFSLSTLSDAFIQERKELLQQYLDQLLSCSELAESIPVKFFLIPHAAGPITDAFYSSKTMLEVCGKGKPWGSKQHRKGGFMSISMVRGAKLSAGSSASNLASPASASGSATCSPLSALKQGVEMGRADAREMGDDVAGVKSAEQDEGEMGDDAGGTTTGQVVRKDGQGDEGNVEGAGKISDDSGVTLNDEADASGRDSPEAAPRHASHVHSASNGHDTIVNEDDQGDSRVNEDDQGDCSRGTGRRINSHQGFMTGPKGVHVSAGEVSDALLALVDELLELGGRGWLRRRTHSLMLLLLNVTSYDLSIEAHILGIVESACGEASLSRMLRCLRELCWPGGGPLYVNRAIFNDEEKALRAVECGKAIMLLLRRSPMAIMLGKASLDRAGVRLSSIAQSRRLNKHLVLCALEILLRLVFPELEDNAAPLV